MRYPDPSGRHLATDDTRYAAYACKISQCQSDYSMTMCLQLRSPQPSLIFATTVYHLLHHTCWHLQVLLRDAVIAADGQTYERQAMQEWLADHSTSPVTGLPLPHPRLTPNLLIKSAIATHLGNYNY